MDGPSHYALARHLLQGGLLVAFNCAALVWGNEMIPNFKIVLQDLIMHVLPRCALQMQKQFMHRELCKPYMVSV